MDDVELSDKLSALKSTPPTKCVYECYFQEWIIELRKCGIESLKILKHSDEQLDLQVSVDVRILSGTFSPLLCADDDETLSNELLEIVGTFFRENKLRVRISIGQIIRVSRALLTQYCSFKQMEVGTDDTDGEAFVKSKEKMVSLSP
jgi:hypothetical protein